MDAVKAFNNELTALYDVKPPISKAKMSSITRSAIKAIKFYKHVVQSVEKFIQKCKPEYKVPGLYVIDSIVRQSRHQFGPDKDLFAPRFAKNMQNTFANLFSCPPEDKGKIIRVLNLWQKNSVFTPDVIQPLFDRLSDPNNSIHKDNVSNSNGLNPSVERTSPSGVSKQSGYSGLNKSSGNPPSDSNTPHWVKLAQTQIDAANKAIYELTGTPVPQAKSSSSSSLDILQQIQQLQQFILSQTKQANEKQERFQSEQVVFDKKLLDFDYDDDDEENTSPRPQGNSGDNFHNILQNPEILRQLTALQQQMSAHQLRQQQLEIEEKMRKLKEMKQQEEEFDKHLAQTVPKLPFASECDLKQYQDSSGSNSLPDLTVPPPGYPKPSHRTETNDSEVECIDDDLNERDQNVEVINLLDRSPSSSPSQTSSRRRHSRSRSRDRRRSRRSRSRSSRSRSRSLRPKRRRRSRSKSRERAYDSEKERERRKKGLPPIKKNHLSVCSTTLWVGHLSKLVQQEELSDTFGGFGDIVSIDVIPPRGCAFICMNRRQDAARALVRLKDHKLHGKVIMLAWAPGKGVKGRDYKDYWEIDLGVSYIPWSRLNANTDFVALEEGGSLDEDTMPDDLKQTILEQLKKRKDEIEAENRMKGLVAPGFIPLPEGMPSHPVPPVLTVPTVMTVPPPVLTTNAGAPPTIDTTQPPPNMSPRGKSVLSNTTIGIQPRIPVMPKPGLMMPPFPFTSLPPPMSLGVPPLMSNLPMGVPPPNMSSLLMQQQMMAIPTSGASPFPTASLIPPITTTSDGSSEIVSDGQGRHPLQGQPLEATNHKKDDKMDLDEEGDKEKRLSKVHTSRDSNPSDDRPKDKDEREFKDQDSKRDDRGRGDRDRDRDRDRRDRGRDRDRDRDRGRHHSRDREEHGRDRDRDYRSRDRDSRRERSRASDRERSRDRGREKDFEGEGSRDGNKAAELSKEGVNQWTEVQSSKDAKPSLFERLRNLAENDPASGSDQMGSIFPGPPPRLPDPGLNRHGPPIVINLNNPGMQRAPAFGVRGPMSDVFRPDFCPPGGPRGPLDFPPRLSFGSGEGMPHEDECRPGFEMRGRGSMDSNDRNRGRFDSGGPRPLMEAHFDGPPLMNDDMRGPLIHDGLRGAIIQTGDMIRSDEMRPPLFMEPPMDDPRMRFGQRGILGPMPRGPMGPHGPPGPVPLFGPRGPRPLLGRPNVWMDNQGPPSLPDNYIRPPFEGRRGQGPGGPRFRGDRTRDRQSRWSKDESKDHIMRSECERRQDGDEDSRNEFVEPPRDTQTPCHDEKPIEELEGESMMKRGFEQEAEQPTQSLSNTTEVVSEVRPPSPVEYDRDTATPCHDEPAEPNIVSENKESIEEKRVG